MLQVLEKHFHIYRPNVVLEKNRSIEHLFHLLIFFRQKLVYVIHYYPISMSGRNTELPSAFFSYLCWTIMLDIKFRRQAREAGTTLKKYVMVNVQNVKEFVCQALNRDVWSHDGVKAIVKDHFVFWQVGLWLFCIQFSHFLLNLSCSL